MKYLYRMLAVSLLMLAAQAHAGKTVVLDVQKALLSSDSAAALREEMKKEFADDQRQLLDLEKQAKSLREQIQKKAGLSSEKEMGQLRMQFQKAFGEYQRRAQELQQRKSQKEQAFVGEMKPKLDEIVLNLIKSEDIDMIIAKQAAIYSNPNLDITARVIELLNK